MSISWGALSRFASALAKGLATAIPDIRANVPPKAPVSLTTAQMAAGLETLQAQLPAIIAAVKAHPGYIRAADDVAEALDAAGFTWAATVEGGVDAVPDALNKTAEWLPTALFFLGGAFSAAPTWGPGPGENRGR